MNDRENSDKAILMTAFAKMDPVALAIAMGTVWAMLIVLATAFLLLKGSPEGQEIGGHLELLGVYLPGYYVSWAGALIGGLYLWVIGAAVGFTLAVLWNLTHYIYVVVIVVRSAWWRMMAD